MVEREGDPGKCRSGGLAVQDKDLRAHVLLTIAFSQISFRIQRLVMLLDDAVVIIVRRGLLYHRAAEVGDPMEA